MTEHYTTEDLMECDDMNMKAHICLHLIYDYEQQVLQPMQGDDDYPIEVLMVSQQAMQATGTDFVRKYAMDDPGTGEPGSIGPFILIGVYEGFNLLISGHQVGAVPTSVILAYGQWMVSLARPFYRHIAGCL